MSSGAFNASFAEDMPQTTGEAFMTKTGIESTLVGEALREVQEALVRVNRAKTSGMLSASIAYELSQPLCAIVASAFACSRWLSAEPPNLHRARRALERIAREGKRASDIIDGIRMLQSPGGPDGSPSAPRRRVRARSASS